MPDKNAASVNAGVFHPYSTPPDTGTPQEILESRRRFERRVSQFFFCATMQAAVLWAIYALFRLEDLIVYRLSYSPLSSLCMVLILGFAFFLAALIGFFGGRFGW